MSNINSPISQAGSPTSSKLEPSSPVAARVPLTEAALESLEASEAASCTDPEARHRLKRSREAPDNHDGDDSEMSPRRKVPRTLSPSTAEHADEASSNHGSGSRKRSHATMAMSEEDTDRRPTSRKVAKTTAYVDLTTSEDEAALDDAVSLTGRERESSSVPSQPLHTSYLHRLPGELRNRIYRDVGLHGARLDLQSFNEPDLAIAIPDLKDELHSIIFSTNKLRVPIYTGYRAECPPDLHKSDLDESNNSSRKAGTIGLAPNSWIMQVDPRFVAIKHICFRVLESGGSDKHLCDFFMNVKVVDGQPRVTHKPLNVVAGELLRNMRPMIYLAVARMKQCAQQEGFLGFTWEQAQHIASSFVSVPDARSRYTRKYGKTMLK